MLAQILDPLDLRVRFKVSSARSCAGLCKAVTFASLLHLITIKNSFASGLPAFVANYSAGLGFVTKTVSEKPFLF